MTEVATRQLPLYRCHKEVRAAMIVDLYRDVEMSRLRMALSNGDSIEIPDAPQFDKAKSGGYYVVYADSYASYSPAKAFEDGYALVE